MPLERCGDKQSAVHVPLGDYLHRVYTTSSDWRIETTVYRLIGADPKAEQNWGSYARSVLAFSAVGVLFLFTLQLVQHRLPWALTDPATEMTPALAWNTAVSFVMGYGMGGAQFVPKPGGGVFIYYLSDDYIRPYQGPTAAAPRPLNTNAHHRPANQEAADIAHTVARHLEGELDDLGAGVEAALADWRGGAYARPRLLNLEQEEVQRLDGEGSFFCSPLKDDMDLD